MNMISISFRLKINRMNRVSVRLYTTTPPLLHTISSTFTSSFRLLQRNKSLLTNTLLWLLLASLAIDLKKEKRISRQLSSIGSNPNPKIDPKPAATQDGMY